MIEFESYCIITTRVSGLGGAQLYTLRRAKYLHNKGIKVFIIVTEDVEFILKDEFANFQLIRITELITSPSLLGRTEVNKILRKIDTFLGLNTDKIAIESHHPILSIWGELTATLLDCKHIIYLLSEPNINSNSFRPFKEYFIWKLKNNELFGISNLSLEIIFRNNYYSHFNNYVNVPFDETEIYDKTVPLIANHKGDNKFVIATLSRLSKAYIEPLILDVIKLSAGNLKMKFYLIVAGDDTNKEILPKLKEKYEGQHNNLEIMFPGYLNPVGKDFFKNIDVFVGMGTAAINSISQRCATITVEPINSKATGIMGLTNNNFAYSESGKIYEIKELIYLFLNDPELLKNAQMKGFELFETMFSMKATMEKLDAFVNLKQENHWNINSFLSFKSRLLSFYASCVFYNYSSLKSLLKKVKKI